MPRASYKQTYIRKWRKRRGLSLRQLADRLESSPGEPLISHASIGRIERGEQPYSQPILEAIAFALNVSVAQLLMVDPTKDGEVIELFNEIEASKRDDAIRILKALASEAS